MPAYFQTTNAESQSDDFHRGSVTSFRSSWLHRHEGQRYYFKRGQPENQIQFAFQNHWRVFQQVMKPIQSGRALEVGCGRGSMGAFFADNGFEVHLLDASLEALQVVRSNFAHDHLSGGLVCADALSLPYPDGTFDVVFSIGLFEHFAEIRQPLLEQLRVLRLGGVFLGYVVPERTITVQTLALPVNGLLRAGYAVYRLIRSAPRRKRMPPKPCLYRNAFTGAYYLAVLRQARVHAAGHFGMFPLPLISHSPGFPFSLMPPPLERLLVRVWQTVLKVRLDRKVDPWTCGEGWGLGFLVWARK